MKNISIRFLICSFFYFSAHITAGQVNPEIAQFNLVLKKAGFYNDKNSDSALYYLRKVDILTRKRSISKERCQYFWTLGDYYKFNKKFDEAEKAYQEMYEIASQMKLESITNTSLYSLGAIKMEKGKFLDAANIYFSLEDLLLKGYYKGGDLLTNESYRNLLFITYNNLAIIFQKLENKTKNEYYLNRMPPLVKTKYDSLIYFFAKSTYSLDESHHKYYKPSLNLAMALKDTFSIKEIYSEMGHWYVKKSDYKNALENSNKSITIKLKMADDWKYDLLNFYTMGVVYLNEGDLIKAEYFLHKALAGFEDNNQLDYQYGVLFYLSELNKKKRNFQKALECFTLGQSIKDSLIGTVQQNRIYQLNVDLQESLYQKQIDTEQNEKKLIIFLLLSSLFFLALLSYNFVQKNKVNLKLEESKRKLEEQSNLLKESNATKDKLFAIISHDLRGPINNLVNYLYLLEDNYTPPKDYLSKLRFNIENVQVVLHNLFNWAEMQIKNSPAKIKKIRMDDIATKVLKQFEDKILEKEIVVENNLNEANIYADENYLHIILRNVISNAVKFTPTKGLIKIDIITQASQSIVSIRDSGVGIKHEQINEVLNYPISKDGTNQEKGSGIGLTLCKELMEKQGGSLTISSEAGNGTEIILKFPFINRIQLA